MPKRRSGKSISRDGERHPGDGPDFDVVSNQLTDACKLNLSQAERAQLVSDVDALWQLYDGDRPVPITDRGVPIAELFT